MLDINYKLHAQCSSTITITDNQSNQSIRTHIVSHVANESHKDRQTPHCSLYRAM